MSMLTRPAPVATLSVYAEERGVLLALLTGLWEDQWERPTGCPGWTVRDIATHLLGDDLGVLSRHRDEFRRQAPRSDETLGVFLARINDEWVTAMRRLSGRVIVELLAWSGGQTQRLWSDLDLNGLGGGVSWAGPQPAPRWLDLAREYTERWVHQQQIREALGLPLMAEDRWIGPVIATFVRALPHTFRTVDAPAGIAVTLVIEGEGGGTWSVVRAAPEGASSVEPFAWELFAGRPGASDALPAAEVRLSADTAWRLFTKGITPDVAVERSALAGDDGLARHLLTSVAIVA